MSTHLKWTGARKGKWVTLLVWGAVGLLTGLLSLVWLSPLQADDDDAPFVADQVVVKINVAAGVTIETINAAYGTTTLDTFLGSAGIYLLQVAPGWDVQTTVDVMEDDPRLIYVEPNFISQAPEGDPSETWAWGGYDPQPYLGQYAIELVQLAQAHLVTQGAGVTVAVLDTGVQLDHVHLVDALTPAGYDFVDDDPIAEDSFNGLDDDNDGWIDEGAGHGTHVAGIIHLVAPEALILPVRVLDSEGQGNYYALAEAIDYAADQGAQVMNLSLGTTVDSDLLQEVVAEATAAGVVLVAAAGNLNSNAVQYPAANPDVLAVTAVGPLAVKADFANYGEWVDMAAPGESITSTFPVDGYAQWSGTSMATPFVAGQAALLRALFPTASAAGIGDIIGATAQPIDHLNPNYSGELGAGLIDAGASVNYAPVSGLAASNDSPSRQGTPTTLTAAVTAGSDVIYTWDLGDGNVSQGAVVSHVYPHSGVFTAVVTASNAVSSVSATTSVVIAPPDILYLSARSSGTADGFPFRDEDIVAVDTETGDWSFYFDGSDVGLGSTDVDAFTLLPDGSILLSLDSASFDVPGLGLVDDSDILRFIPTSTGLITAGSFEMWLDGSDVGLDSDAEDIDAIGLAPNGELIISTMGNFSLTFSGRDEDLLRFTPQTLGWETSGTWSFYFDGSDVGLAAFSEDIGGVWVDPASGAIHLSVAGAFTAPGVSGDGLDVFSCLPTALGPDTGCTFNPDLYWDGSNNNLEAIALDGFFIWRQP